MRLLVGFNVEVDLDADVVDGDEDVGRERWVS